MDKQQMFDAMVNGIRAQGGPSGEMRPFDESDPESGKRFVCLYRGPNGRKCAAGLLITDAEYVPGMENCRVTDAEVRGRLESDSPLLPFPDLAREVQCAHDSAAGDAYDDNEGGIDTRAFFEIFESRAEEVAQQFDIKYTPPGN